MAPLQPLCDDFWDGISDMADIEIRSRQDLRVKNLFAENWKAVGKQVKNTAIIVEGPSITEGF